MLYRCSEPLSSMVILFSSPRSQALLPRMTRAFSMPAISSSAFEAATDLSEASCMRAMKAFNASPGSAGLVWASAEAGCVPAEAGCVVEVAARALAARRRPAASASSFLSVAGRLAATAAGTFASILRVSAMLDRPSLPWEQRVFTSSESLA